MSSSGIFSREKIQEYIVAELLFDAPLAFRHPGRHAIFPDQLLDYSQLFISLLVQLTMEAERISDR